MQLSQAEEYVWKLLKAELPGYLYYHGITHTEKVLEACMELAKNENINNHDDLCLLKTAALFHDCGFVRKYDGHEKAGCDIAKSVLPGMGYEKFQIDKICSMIMATKLPQNPENKLEKILCDADLYYLGSDSFYEVSDKLCNEWLAIKKVQNEKTYNKIQIEFLEAHKYWTDSARLLRSDKKEKHLQHLKKKIHQTF